ncbi:MAG: phage terminase large subunit [Flavobacteriaceae bacterium]|nr:phage terminase large subunit [Flavobacteriaceae bacterium]
MNSIDIRYVSKLHPIFTKPKRIKIIVGGRGSTKSTGIADYVAAKIYSGDLWCCARENQNSIEESVHRTLLEEIERLHIPGFTDTKTSITHEQSGGRAFYRGLARNITSLKSTLSGVDGLWIEEGEDISDNTLRVLTASVRLNATDTEKLLNDKTIESIDDLDALLADSSIKMPEIIITMNRGVRNGAIAKKWLSRAEKELSRCGYYEDDTIMVVEMSYTDMPRSWFIASGLEQERLDDKDRLSNSAYRHKWDGAYLDEVEDAIIKGEWFDACIDAHKLERLKKAFEPHGCKIAVHDPFNDGEDAGGYVLKHGSIIKRVLSKTKGAIDETCDWATDHAIKDGADWFVWDEDGMGAGLKRQISDNFNGTKIKYHGFRGGLSGKGQDNAEQVYQQVNDDKDEAQKTYMETFLNNRAQYYTALADRMFNTYKCVVRGEYIDPEDMISFDSDGVDNMLDLRSQLTRIPRVANGKGLQQIMNKKEMKSNKIDSPNEGDCVMMSLFKPIVKKVWKTLNYNNSGIV